MTRDTAERAREWMNSRGLLDDGYCGHDIHSLTALLTQIQAEARLEEAKWWLEKFSHDGVELTQEVSTLLRARIAALAQALQLEEREGT